MNEGHFDLEVEQEADVNEEEVSKDIRSFRRRVALPQKEGLYLYAKQESKIIAKYTKPMNEMG